LQHTKTQLLAVESAIPQAFLANGLWGESRGMWVGSVHAARNGKDVARLLERLESVMPPALFLTAWKDAPGLVHNRHVQQVKTLVDMPQRRKTTRRTPKEMKELQRLKMEKLEAAQSAADERRRVKLGQRRKAAAARAPHKKDMPQANANGSDSISPMDAGPGAATSLATGQVGQGRNSAWTVTEMELLISLVRTHGMGNWEIVAAGLNSGRSVGSITQKYYKLTRGDSAMDGRAGKRSSTTGGGAKASVANQKRQVELMYNEWDDPTVPDSELNVLQRALRREKELRSVSTQPTEEEALLEGKSNDSDNGGKMTELQIQDELSTQFGEDIDEYMAEEEEKRRKARRKTPQPAEWDFERLFKGWRWDIREHEAERHLYRELLTQTQVLRLARRGGRTKVAEFLYHLDEPEGGGSNVPGAPSHMPGFKKPTGPVYQKVEYDNGTAFWGKMHDETGLEDIGAIVDERKKKKMVQFVDGKIFILRQDDALHPVATQAMKKAEESPTQPTIASPRSARAAARKQRLPARRKLRAADTPILSATGSWRYGVRRATTAAAAQLHLSCLVSAMAWSRLMTVDTCDRPLAADQPQDFMQSLTNPPDPERECWMELAVRGTMDAIVNAVALHGEGHDETTLRNTDPIHKMRLGADAIEDNQGETIKQQKRVNDILQQYDRRRIALEGKRRTTMAQLTQQLAHKKHNDALAQRRAAGSAAPQAAIVRDGDRIAYNSGGGSGSGRRKGQDWTQAELTKLVDLVKIHGR